jgi:hypothetical protein
VQLVCGASMFEAETDMCHILWKITAELSLHFVSVYRCAEKH